MICHDFVLLMLFMLRPNKNICVVQVTRPSLAIWGLPYFFFWKKKQQKKPIFLYKFERFCGESVPPPHNARVVFLLAQCHQDACIDFLSVKIRSSKRGLGTCILRDGFYLESVHQKMLSHRGWEWAQAIRQWDERVQHLHSLSSTAR